MLGERGGDDDDIYAGRRKVKNVSGVVGRVASKLPQKIAKGLPTPRGEPERAAALRD